MDSCSNPSRMITRMACPVLFLISIPGHSDISGSLVFATNYVFRGYSKSDGHPVGRANLDYEHSTGFYLGTWVSSVDFGDDGFDDRANVEMSPYIGWNFPISDDWQVDTYLTRYIYDGKIFGHDSDYNELDVLVNFRDLVTARFAWSDDLYNQGSSAFDYELTGRYALTDTFEMSAGVGLSETNEALEYNYLYWNLGVTWYFFKHGAMDFRYAQAARFAEKANKNPWPFDPPMINDTFIFSISVGF